MEKKIYEELKEIKMLTLAQIDLFRNILIEIKELRRIKWQV